MCFEIGGRGMKLRRGGPWSLAIYDIIFLHVSGARNVCVFGFMTHYLIRSLSTCMCVYCMKWIRGVLLCSVEFLLPGVKVAGQEIYLIEKCHW